MTLKEKIKMAIAHKSYEGIPINIEVTAAFAKNVTDYCNTLDVDAVLCNHMLRKKYKLNTVTPDCEIDLFGVHWSKSKDGGDVGIVTYSPLNGKDLSEYKFPEINTQFADSLVKDLENEKDKYTMFSITMGFFERAWSLCGMEDLLMDMILEPERVQAVFEGIYNHHDTLLNRVLKGNFDAVYFGDDWGQQNGLIMGPDMWRKYIKPYVSKLFDKIKRAGKQIVLHSCGDLREIMGDVIDMGVDVYNTVQPEIYDLSKLKNQYGKNITFYGGISTQQFLPFATVEQVKEETKRVLDIMAEGGGYILSPTHAVTDDIPVQNILALIETGEKFIAKEHR